MTEPSGRSLTFLWFIDFDFSTRLHHGATLRHLNYARELLALGHRVYFVVQLQAEDAELSRRFFSELKEQGTFTDFFDCTYSYPRWKGRIATLAVLPALANRWLARNRLSALRYSRELAFELGADVCIFSKPQIFLPATLLRQDLHEHHRFRRLLDPVSLARSSIYVAKA